MGAGYWEDEGGSDICIVVVTSLLNEKIFINISIYIFIMPELETLSKSKPAVFSYTGSVKNGTVIVFETNNSKEEIKADVYSNLLNHFRGSTVMAGTSHDIKKDINLKGSIGHWLYVDTNGPKLSGSVVTSYLCSILTHEGFCKSFTDGNKIMIRFLSEYPI